MYAQDIQPDNTEPTVEETPIVEDIPVEEEIPLVDDTNVIEEVIEEYSIKTSFKNDLDFALSLNLKISYFILDTVQLYSEDIFKKFATEFNF